MSLSIKRLIKNSIFHRHFHLSKSQTTTLNGRRLLCSSSTELCYSDQRRRRRERWICRQQMCVCDGISLPLSRLIHSYSHRRLHRSHCEISCILPHSLSRSHLQEKMPPLISRVSNVDLETEEQINTIDVNRFLIPFYNLPSSCLKGQSSCRLSHYSQSLQFLERKIPALNYRVFSSRAFSRVSIVDSERDEEKEEIRFDRVDGQATCVVPHSSQSLQFVFQRKMPALNCMVFNSRPFSRSSNVDSETDQEKDEIDEDGGGESEGVKSTANPSEVERVCKVIDELLDSDRNMEAVLDQCGIDLSHDLVVDVLARFKHARRPAFRFFCWAEQKQGFEHDSRTYNSMMAILGKTRQFESMVVMLEEMGKKGLLTIETFSIAIRAFAAAREMKKAVGIFELMKRYKFKADVDTFNCLLDALGRAKLGEEAQTLFEKLKDRFTPDLRTYTVLLAGWCKLRKLIEAGKVWNEMIDKDLKPDIVAHNIMLEGLLRCRKNSEAIKLFELMKARGPSPNVRSYTILIRDLCKGDRMKEAVRYFDEMLDSGCKPDPAVYTCLIVGFGNQKKMDMVYGLLQEMKEKDCPPDGRTYNALIKLMTNRQMPDDAVRIYKKMIKSGHQPTIHTYNMMMKSYFYSKNYDMGFAVWEEMGKKGCCPDDNSYTVFIGGLIRNGRAEEACKYIEEMLEKGMKAPQLDYNKFAADFSKAGKPDILEELAQKMKFSGKFEVSNMFARWSEMMKKRVKRRP